MADVATVGVTLFTDPFCPWSWAAEPLLRRLQVEFGEQLELTFVVVGLQRDIRDGVPLALATLDAAAESAMPADARVFLRDPPSSTYPAGLALHAVAEQGPVGPYLRRLREAVFLEGRRMDAAPALLDAARETLPALPGLDLERLRVAFGSNAIVEALGADLERARAVDPAQHDPATGRVRTPSLEARGPGGTLHGAYGPGPYARWREAVTAAGGLPGTTYPGVEDALGRFGALATPEVAQACDLPGPRAPSELWRLALEWRVKPGPLWSAA